MSAILNQLSATAQPLAALHAIPLAASNTTPGTSSSDGSSAAISANDFLTLLVTEMKNQDPTATTDPNEYINQLVNVNSLEQLIDINQTLTSAYESSSAPNASPAEAKASLQQAVAQNRLIAQIPESSPGPSLQTLMPSGEPGNLSVPATSPAAERLAQALGVNTRSPSVVGVSAAR